MSRYTCTCASCAAVFKTRSNLQRYCSLQCSADARALRHTMTCKQCGTQYLGRNYMVMAGKGNYCSSRCHNDSKGSLYPRAKLYEIVAASGLAGATSKVLIDTLTPGLTAEQFAKANKLISTAMTKMVTRGMLSTTRNGRYVTYRVRVNQPTSKKPVAAGVTIKDKIAGGFVGPVIVPDGVKFTKCPSPGYGRFGEIITATEAPRLFRDIPLGALA